MRILDLAIREAFRAPLDVEDGPKRLGRAVWLYLALVLAANSEGLVVRRTDQLAEGLGVDPPTIEGWLRRLSDARLIARLSPSPYLAIRLRMWPAGSEQAGYSADVGDSHSNSSASSNRSSNNAGDRGEGEGDDLRTAIAAVLPEADEAEVTRILARYSRAILQKTLDRVERTPAERIRKSRAALFRFLLAKFSESIDVRDL